MKIRERVDNIRKLYATAGYINFTPVPNTSIEDRTRAMDLEIDVDEGAVYRLDNVTLLGVGRQREMQLLQKFPLYPADIFNPSAVEKFYRENAEDHQADPLTHISVKQNVVVHTVDVTLDFGRRKTSAALWQHCPTLTDTVGR